MAFLDSSVASNSGQSILRALLPLAQTAEFHRCVILLIRHLNKTYRSCALYRGGGSIGVIGACRSACLVAPDPLDPGRRVLAQVKNNLGPKQASLGFELVAGEQGVAMVRWLGPARWGADELLARQLSVPRVTPRDRAGEFLLSFLKAGPRTSRDIWTAALAQHFNEPTLRRAKADLGIRSRRVWAEGRRLSYWMLPGQQLPPEAGNAAGPAAPSAGDAAQGAGKDEDFGDLEPWLGPLREKYPPLTPLDEA